MINKILEIKNNGKKIIEKVFLLISYSLLGWIFIIFLSIWFFWVQNIYSKLIIFLHLIFFLIPFFLIFHYKKLIKFFIWFLIFLLFVDFLKITYLEIPSWNWNLKSVYIWSKRKNNFWNLLNEKDWVEFGTMVNKVAWIGDMQESKLFDSISLTYDDMQSQTERKYFDSQIGVSLNELFWIKTKITHYYFSSSPKSTHKKLIIFLHGSAGNFEIYPYRFQSLANGNDVDIVYPSFWWWDRNQPWGVETINKVVDDVQRKYNYQNKELTLMALSNWWKWLTRFIQQWRYSIQNVIFISAVMENSIIKTNSFLDSAKKIKNFYILHWDKDERILISNIKTIENYLKQNWVNIQSKYISRWTHFVLIDVKDQLIKKIEEFLK